MYLRKSSHISLMKNNAKFRCYMSFIKFLNSTFSEFFNFFQSKKCCRWKSSIIRVNFSKNQTSIEKSSSFFQSISISNIFLYNIYVKSTLSSTNFSHCSSVNFYSPFHVESSLTTKSLTYREKKVCSVSHFNSRPS